MIWYQSSQQAERVFFDLWFQFILEIKDDDEIGIWPGSLDHSPKLRGKEHIYCSSMAGYYEIEDGLPKHDFFPGYENEGDVYGAKKKL